MAFSTATRVFCCEKRKIELSSTMAAMWITDGYWEQLRRSESVDVSRTKKKIGKKTATAM